MSRSRAHDQDGPNPWTPAAPEPQSHAAHAAASASSASNSNSTLQLPLQRGPGGRPGPLQLLLLRLASKLEERSHTPWLLLQQRGYYIDKSGIHSVAELDHALQHFHVMLSPVELSMIFNAFPLSSSDSAAPRMMDMKSLANALWPRDTEVVFGIRDGRARSPKGRRRPTEPPKMTDQAQHAKEEEQKQQQHPLFHTIGSGDANHTLHPAAASSSAGATLVTTNPVGTVPSVQALASDRSFEPYGHLIGSTTRQREGYGVRRTLNRPKDNDINSLHTPRGLTMLQRAAAASIAGPEGNGAASQRKTKPLPHYMQPSNTRNLPPASVRADGHNHTQRGAGGAGVSAALGASTSRDRAANSSIPRIDFLNLRAFEPKRYERSAASKERVKQFVHTAR